MPRPTTAAHESLTNPGYWKSPAIWFATLTSLAFVLLGLRAILVPTVSSAGFGLPMTGPQDTLWVQIYGSRTVLLGVFSLVLVVTRQPRPLSLLLALGALVPFFDMAIITSQQGIGTILLRHAAYVVWLGGVALLLWRRRA